MEKIIEFISSFLVRNEQISKEVNTSRISQKIPSESIDIINACEKHWNIHKDNCSGFVKAVAGELNIELSGQANDIVDKIQNPPWKILPDGIEANRKATEGKLVIAGRKESVNGHVVVVVSNNGKELSNGKYPYAYWGQLNAIGKKGETINYAWIKEERDSVIYSYCDL